MDAGFYLVRRRKCFVRHFGVLAELPGRPAEVFELLPEGYRVTDLATFAAGRPVSFSDLLCPARLSGRFGSVNKCSPRMHHIDRRKGLSHPFLNSAAIPDAQ